MASSPHPIAALHSTAVEFQAAVLSFAPRTAVFDCDGTLWAPDSGRGFMLWSLERGMVAPARQAWIEERYRLYEMGPIDEATICGEMVQLYAGLREADLRRAAQEYVSTQIAPLVFPAMASLLAALHKAGTQLWAVSSTASWVIEAGLAGFPIPPERVLAATVASLEGVITDRLLAVPTDEAKAEALAAAGLPRPDAVFGNSIHDAAMLAIARRPFPVNANAELASLAGERGWRIFYP